MAGGLEYISQSEVKVRGKRTKIVRDVREACRTIRPGENVSWDLETSGLSPWRDKIAVVSMYGEESKIPIVIHCRGLVDPDLRRLLQSARLWIGHNTTNFDRLFEEEEGIDTFAEGVEHYDTLVGEGAARVSGRHDVRVNLKATLARRLGRKISKDVNHNSWMQPELDAEQLLYCVDDVMSLSAVRYAQLKKVEQEGRPEVMDFEQELCDVTCAMTLTGLPLDVPKLKAWQADLFKQMDAAEPFLRKFVGDIRLSSPVVLKPAIEKAFGIELPNTQKETLSEIADADAGDVSEFCKRLLLWRMGNKRTGMYDDKWLQRYVEYDGRIHGRFWQTGTDTLRYSGTDPNLQQWPRNGRDNIGGEPGRKTVSADYDAIEVMIGAGLANDEQMLADCEGDPHARLAASITGIPEDELPREQRRLAKAANFTMEFCGGWRRFHAQCRLGDRNISEAATRAYYDAWLQRYRGLAAMRNQAFAMANRRVVQLNFPAGHRRVLAGPEVTPTRIINNVVQATAAIGMKRGLIKLHQKGLVRGYLGAVVHDEAVASAPDNEAEEYGRELERCMVEGMLETIPNIPCRVKAKIGTHWS